MLFYGIYAGFFSSLWMYRGRRNLCHPILFSVLCNVSLQFFFLFIYINFHINTLDKWTIKVYHYTLLSYYVNELRWKKSGKTTMANKKKETVMIDVAKDVSFRVGDRVTVDDENSIRGSIETIRIISEARLVEEYQGSPQSIVVTVKMDDAIVNRRGMDIFSVSEA